MGRTNDAKDRILEQAGRLFHERGFRGVGIGDICSAAAVNKGSFYHFFPSKQQLALDVIDAYWHDARSFVEETLLADRPPLERLADYCERLHTSHVARCTEHGKQRGCPLANFGIEMSTQDIRLRERVLSAFESQIGYFEHLVREAKQRDEVAADVDPRAAAEAFIAFLQGKIMLSKLRDDPEALKNLLPEAKRLLGVLPA